MSGGQTKTSPTTARVPFAIYVFPFLLFLYNTHKKTRTTTSLMVHRYNSGASKQNKPPHFVVLLLFLLFIYIYIYVCAMNQREIGDVTSVDEKQFRDNRGMGRHFSCSLFHHPPRPFCSFCAIIFINVCLLLLSFLLS